VLVFYYKRQELNKSGNKNTQKTRTPRQTETGKTKIQKTTKRAKTNK